MPHDPSGREAEDVTYSLPEWLWDSRKTLGLIAGVGGVMLAGVFLMGIVWYYAIWQVALLVTLAFVAVVGFAVRDFT